MVLLFANGDIADYSWLSPYFAQATAVIGIDGGTQHIINAGVMPTTILGDFDSIDATLLNTLLEQGVQAHRYPSEKNETDLELALLLATENPLWLHEEIGLFGVLGGRLDQTLANIMLLAHPQLQNRTVKLIAQHQTAWLISDQGTIHGQVGDLVSLIPLGGDCQIETTHNLRWPLHNEPLYFGPARGVSNELIAPTAELSLSSGQLLCIHTNHNWGR